MAALSTYDLAAEPVGDVYRELLGHATRRCPTGLVVLRPGRGMALEPAGAAALGSLVPWTVSRHEARSWPGTALGLGARPCVVIRFRLNEHTLGTLGRAGRLFAWVQPALPEDLCLLREDGRPWLTTIAHERVAYLELTEEEHQELRRAVPNLALARPAAS